MKIVFIQEFIYEWQAPMIFSAIAKEKGHVTYMIIESNYKKAVSKALLHKPDLLVFSNIVSGNINFVYKCAALIKQKCDIPIIVGGIYVSLNYRYIDMTHIDMLGIGEGELLFKALLDTKLQERLYPSVPGLIYKYKGDIKMNPPQFVKNIDEIPLMDRELYYSYQILRREKVRMFYSGRGCRYNCSYCCVPKLTDMDPYVNAIRKRSPESLIKEILDVNARWGMKIAFFQDDTFTQDIQWLEEFLPLYKKYINKPYMCLTRAKDIAQESTVDLLYRTGCVSVGIGIETANEHTRCHLLNRKETNESIIKAIEYLRARNIRITTFNMIGIPQETISDIYETIKFNRMIKVDSAWAVYYQPYIGNIVKDKAEVSECGNFYFKFSIKHPQKDELEILQKLFPYLVKYPLVSRFIKNKAIKALSYFLFALHSFYREIYIWHRSFFLTLIVGIRNQLQYKKNSLNQKQESFK